MKKTRLFFVVFISLLGTFLLIWNLFLFIRNSQQLQLPPLPPNLNAQAATAKINVTIPVPILMYHHIQVFPGSKNPSDGDIFVSPQNFESDLKWLSENNFQTVNLDYFKNPIPLGGGKKPIVLTFDDGYQDAYTTAFTLLKKYGFTATFYPIVNDIDKSGFITTREILEMQKDGMHFGSHTLSHPDLTKTNELQTEQEIYASKIILERKTGAPVSDFCYPGGAYNSNAENIVANSGYETATTTVSGTNQGILDPLSLKRLFIKNDTNLSGIPELNSK